MLRNYIFCFWSINLVILNAQDFPVHYELNNDLTINQVSPNVFVYSQFSNTERYGRFSSNGAIFRSGNEAVLVDTPVSDSLTRLLIEWCRDSLGLKVSVVIPTHWHVDCLGGLNALHSMGATSYANEMTIDLAKQYGMPLPQKGFADSITLLNGDRTYFCDYPGGGHSTDNIVVWFPDDKVLFGGCMVKSLSAQGLGNIDDADLSAWPTTIRKVKEKYSSAVIVVPGHGEYGDRTLLDYTLELLNR